MVLGKTRIFVFGKKSQTSDPTPLWLRSKLHSTLTEFFKFYLQTTSIHNTFNTHMKLAHYLMKGSCK